MRLSSLCIPLLLTAVIACQRTPDPAFTPLTTTFPGDGGITPDPEEAGIRAALEHYLAGHATGDSAHHRLAFHPESKLFWIRDGQFMQRTSDAYIAGSPGKPAADEAQRRRRIVSIDRTGTAAIAKVELDYPTTMFTDYMSLLKLNGEWRIVNKIFYSAPKAPAP